MSCASNLVRFDSFIPPFFAGSLADGFFVGIELDEDVMRPRTP